METLPLSASFGVEVIGVDLHSPLDETALAELVGLVHEHALVLFREQHLDDAAHDRLARSLGEPCVHPIGRLFGREASVEHIIDDADSHPYQDRWHTDISFLDVPPLYGTLRAIDLPDRGGDTLWADMRQALAAVSPVLSERIRSLEAIHDSGSGEAFREKAGDEIVDRLEREYPGQAHPVVLRHPLTGVEALYVNRQFTRSIVGMSPAESAMLLDVLCTTAESPNLQYRHHWSVGDVMVWDERATQHFAAADHYPRRREMARMTATPAHLLAV